MSLNTPGYNHGGLDALFDMARASPIRPDCETFYFLRHGETDGNHKRIYQTAEQLLNERGLAQAAAAAEAYKAANLERVVASTMERAWRTAVIVAKPHGLDPHPEDGLRERWFGDWVGTPSANSDWRSAPPNGETLETFVTRTQAGLKRSLADAGKSRTLLVGHGGILYVLGPSLGIDLETEMMANATPLRFDQRGGKWQVTKLADTGGRSDNVN
jgi:broad specificity phosphatase PhoE